MEDNKHRLNWLRYVKTSNQLYINRANEISCLWNILGEKQINLLVWYPNIKAKAVSKIKKVYPKIDWIVICQNKNIFDLYKWRKLVSPKAVWWVGDLFNIDYIYFFYNIKEQQTNLSPSLQLLYNYPFLQLTKMDKKLLYLIQKGFTSIEISKSLYCSESSVFRHKKILKERMGITNSNDCELIQIAQIRGYIDLKSIK